MSKLKKKKKPLFHAPQKTGEIRKIPTTVPMKVISIVSLVVLLALLAFAIFAAVKKNGEYISLSGTTAMAAPFLFLIFALVPWIIGMGFRLAVRFIPLEMWRLPRSVKEATIQTSGKYLKYATLLIELETALSFGYICLVLYHGQIPGDIPVLIWVLLVAATVIFFGRYVLIAAEREK